jgi:hypothetical protein
MKKHIAILIFSLCALWPTLAFESFLGPRLELGHTMGFGKGVGSFKDYAQLDGVLGDYTPVSVTQSFQLTAQTGLVYQAQFVSWFALVTEFGVGFNNGLTYKGNYNPVDAGDVDRIDKPALDGTMRYSWTSLDLNLIGLFTVARPNSAVRINLLVGPTLSMQLGGIREIFTAPSHSQGAPYTEDTKGIAQNVAFVNAGIVAGIGTQIAVGPGLITIEGRTNWGFVAPLVTHMSKDKPVFIARPFSINLAYSFRMP